MVHAVGHTYGVMPVWASVREVAAIVALYPASAAVVESAPAKQQDDEKDDDESVCVHDGVIMSGHCVFWLFCFEQRVGAGNR